MGPMEALPPGPWGFQGKPCQCPAQHPGTSLATAVPSPSGGGTDSREGGAAAPDELGWQTMFFKKQKPSENNDTYLAPQVSVVRHSVNTGKLCTSLVLGFAWATDPQTPAKGNEVRCL